MNHHLPMYNFIPSFLTKGHHAIFFWKMIFLLFHRFLFESQHFSGNLEFTNDMFGEELSYFVQGTNWSVFLPRRLNIETREAEVLYL